MPGMEDDVRNGLFTRPRSLPSKYFYDENGSQLFDRICDTPEYYVTRTEAALLHARSIDIIAAAKPDHIIELGSGVSRKTRYLFDACEQLELHAQYWPYDVCEPILQSTAESLIVDYPWLNVNALVGDYHAGFAHLPSPAGRRMYVFLGGTIGNFTHEETIAFLRELREHMREGDTLLLGADRIKNMQVLHAAYNDTAGITAEFNLNVLRVLNRALGADFDVSAFEHYACFNTTARQVEMYLIATRAQQVSLGAMGETLELAEAEAILTEISRKFTKADLQEIVSTGGFEELAHYEPDNGYFSLVLVQPT